MIIILKAVQNLFFSQLAVLRNSRNTAAVNRDSQEDLPRDNVSRDTNVFRVNEGYITHLSEEIDGRVNKKLCQKFSRTKSQLPHALSKLYEFLLN